jgi:hypothetical protein
MSLSNASLLQAVGRCIVGLTLAVPLCAWAAAPAVDLPPLQQGQWQFRRSVTNEGQRQPVVRTMQMCSDPSADIRRKWEELVGQTCQFSPVQHVDNKYTYSAVCTKNGVSTRMMSTITVRGDSAYNAVTQSYTAEHRSSEIVSARRIGACGLQPTQQPTR